MGVLHWRDYGRGWDVCFSTSILLSVTNTLALPQNRVVLLNYRDDGETPYMVFWKHGLKEEKV